MCSGKRERNRDSVSNESRIVYQDRLFGASLFMFPFTRANMNDSVNFLFIGTVSFRIPQSVSPWSKGTSHGTLVPGDARIHHHLAKSSLSQPVQRVSPLPAPTPYTCQVTPLPGADLFVESTRCLALAHHSLRKLILSHWAFVEPGSPLRRPVS